MSTKVASTKDKDLVFVIEYRCRPEDCNLVEVLDRLSEIGSANVLDVHVEEMK